MAVGIRSQKYRDPVGRKHRRWLWLKRTMITLVCGAIIAGGVWGGRHLLASAGRYFQHPTPTPAPQVAIGTWCRGGECQFFDDSGVRWGSALQSSGSLFLLVDDQRTEDASTSVVFEGLMTAVRGLPPLGLSAKRVTLPDAEPGGVVLKTPKGYDLYIDALGDVPEQLKVLALFLADRAKDPSFAPQYIDLRTSGRVYFK